MKTLLLIRHAKSSWENFTVADIDRPLNERGKKNAQDMAARLEKRGLRIDTFLSSPAKRTMSTARLFVDVLQQDRGDIIEIPDLYHANKAAFLKTIRAVPNDPATIALFSHNPGITEFVNSLCSTRVDQMPTCAIFAVKCAIGSWAEFEPGSNEFYFFDFPRNQ